MLHKLKKLQADTYLLLIKTHNYHWNVEGINFYPVHLLLEQQYTELFAEVDVIAERIRALNDKALGTPEEFLSHSSIKSKTTSDVREIAEDLVASHMIAVESAKEVIFEGEKNHDAATVDLATNRIEAHQKYIWMLKNLLK